MADFLDRTDGAPDLDVSTFGFGKDGPGVRLPTEEFSGADVEQRGQCVGATRIGVGGVQDDDGNTRFARSFDALADGFGIGARNANPVDLAGKSIVQKHGHILDREGRVAQPLDFDAIALTCVLHAFDHDVPERVARPPVRHEGEAIGFGCDRGAEMQNGGK